MDLTQSTNVEWGDARLALGAAFMTSDGKPAAEAKLALLLSGADSDQAVRQSMIEAVERLLGDVTQIDLDLSQADKAAWIADLTTIRDKLRAGV
jgi:hypothetical protein